MISSKERLPLPYSLLIVMTILSCQTIGNEKPKEVFKPDTEEPFFHPIVQERDDIESLHRKKKPYMVNLKKPVDNILKPKNRVEEQRISINFKSASLKTVMKMISNNGNNFRYSIHPKARNKTVMGLTLKDVTWRDALDILIKTHDLKMIEEHSLYIITTRKAHIADLTSRLEIAKLEKENSGMREATVLASLKREKIEEARKTSSKSFQLKYIQPGEVKDYFDVMFSVNESIEPKADRAKKDAPPSFKEEIRIEGTVSFSIFPNSSILTVHGPPSVIAEVEMRLAEIDIPQKQVYIESRIVEVLRDHTSSLGIEWGGQKLILNDTPLSITGGAETSSGSAGNIINSGFRAGTRMPGVSFPAIDTSGTGLTPAGISAVLRNSSGTARLMGRLSALEQEGKSRTLSNPKVTTINGKPAKIESGREIPYQASAGGSAGATVIKFKNAVISLEVTPFVTPDNGINLKIVAKKDDADFTKQVLGVPTILTRSIETNVMVYDGGTVVLGGVFENLEADAQSGVPFLSKIPIFGLLFKGTTRADNERELLIFVTPRIVKDNNL